MCGSEIITRQQKNTSFGAHEFRDGVSYNEHYHKQPLVEEKDLASLAIGECYALLPEPTARLSKLQIPEATITNKNPGFIPKTVMSDTTDNQYNYASTNTGKNEADHPNSSGNLAESSSKQLNNSNSRNLNKKRSAKKLGKKHIKSASLETRSAKIL